MWRSLLAVFGGWIVIQILIVGTDEVLMRAFPRQYGTGQMAPDWMMALRLALGVLYTVFGGWLTALLAPERPWRHAVYLILAGESMGLFTAVTSLGLLQGWYIAGLLVLFPPAVLAGAWLRLRGGKQAGAGAPQQ